MERLPQDVSELVFKIIIPALVAISLKLAVQSKKIKISFFNGFASVVIGVGSAYITSSWVMESFEDKYVPIVIACITISGEKIAEWLIFKFNFDEIGDGFIDVIINKLKNNNK